LQNDNSHFILVCPSDNLSVSGHAFSQYIYFQLEKLPDNINSPYAEITPVPSRDGRTLYFTRVGHPDFNQTLLIDSVDMSATLTDKEYLSVLSEVYTQISGKKVFNPVLSSFNQDIWIAQGRLIRLCQDRASGVPVE
jgi:hypothetical protein